VRTPRSTLKRAGLHPNINPNPQPPPRSRIAVEALGPDAFSANVPRDATVPQPLGDTVMRIQLLAAYSWQAVRGKGGVRALGSIGGAAALFLGGGGGGGAARGLEGMRNGAAVFRPPNSQHPRKLLPS
jgi:hypothetical protein